MTSDPGGATTVDGREGGAPAAAPHEPAAGPPTIRPDAVDTHDGPNPAMPAPEAEGDASNSAPPFGAGSTSVAAATPAESPAAAPPGPAAPPPAPAPNPAPVVATAPVPPVAAGSPTAAPAKNPWRTAVLAGAALLLAGLAGFGGAKLAGAGGDESPAAPKATERSDAAADAATVDPCALITEAEVGSAVGPATVAKSGSTCRFTPTGTSAFAGVAIAVSDKTLQRPADFRIGLEVIAKAAGTTVEPVTGVGDEAYITRITSSIPMVQIAVRKGNRIFSLVALGGASLEDGGVAVVSNLAGKAVGRF